jgi:hypothetical protein
MNVYDCVEFGATNATFWNQIFEILCVDVRMYAYTSATCNQNWVCNASP